jgi:hypothetical protein
MLVADEEPDDDEEPGDNEEGNAEGPVNGEFLSSPSDSVSLSEASSPSPSQITSVDDLDVESVVVALDFGVELAA